MDGHRKRDLPRTPRIIGPILEYYRKYGHGRDLEKFMRIYSPAGSSQDSQGTHPDGGEYEACCGRPRIRSRDTVSSSSSEALAMMPSRPLSGCCGVNSKSMPNIDVQGQSNHLAMYEDVMVNINIELEEELGKILSASTENIQTPKKQTHADKNVQTPESVAKTHRRLEWDSLADIGYKKSMSTSNISVLERSLLKEFFKENSVISEPEPSTSHKVENVPDEQHPPAIEQHKTIKTTKASVAAEHATPPLASSTLVEGLSDKAINRGARPKMISQSTSSTSLQKKFEKYAQTSLLKPATTNSKEIQVSMSSSTSVIEGTATPSSFEYYSSRSSKSRSSRSSGCISSNFSNTDIPPAQHPFITSITDLLKKRKALNEKTEEKRKQYDSIRHLQSKFQAALDENKENQSTVSSNASTVFSLTRQAPELDLGIQLICSLIDAKSVNEKQKKKLIRDIVKRITRLNDDELDIGNSNHSAASVSSEKQQKVYDAVYSRRRSAATTSQAFPRENIQNSNLGVAPIQPIAEAPIHSNNQNNGQTSTSKTTQQKVLGNSNQQSWGSNSSNNKQRPKSTAIYENHNKVSIPAINPIQKHSTGTQCEYSNATKSRPAKAKVSETETHSVLNIKNTRSTQTQTSKSLNSTDSKKSQLAISSRTASSDNATTSSSSSHNLPTQKSLRKNVNEVNANVETEQPTMREWLNPLTQSEIDYEEKKREEAVDMESSKREKHAKKTKNDSGRSQQLSWIENEIHRLECLKHLLLKDDTDNTSSINPISDESSNRRGETINSTQTDKLYDTVFSDKSSVLSESAERLVKEIEVILEESSEDLINFKDNTKTSKERKKETQIVYDQPLDKNQQTAKYRSIKETTTINEEQLLPPPPPPSKQRQKIDTPTSEQSQSEATESVRDLVKLRKHEFMEAYKTKKQNHYDALKQQQKKQGKFKYVPIKTMPITKERSTFHSGHYSVPHTINRNFSPTEYAYPQSHLPPTPDDKHNKSPANVIYSTTAPFFNHRHNEKNKQTSTSTPIATTSSSTTSMFCISSDVSVPMGNNGSSTPTTTHHYDDVAAAVAGVAVQTSDSILRSQPIFDRHLHPYCFPKHTASTNFKYQSVISNTAAIQVKPKGIAYVIEFDANKNAVEKHSEPEKSVNAKSIESMTNTQLLKKVSSEPQLTLQEHLEKAKPKFLQHTKERKAILNELQALRQARDRQLREIVDNTSFKSLERRLKYLPPPPMQKVRILKTKEMKALTNKRVASLPEVVAKKQREIEERKRRGNRIIRDVFNLRLQKRVRNGKLSLNLSRTVI